MRKERKGKERKEDRRKRKKRRKEKKERKKERKEEGAKRKRISTGMHNWDRYRDGTGQRSIPFREETGKPPSHGNWCSLISDFRRRLEEIYQEFIIYERAKKVAVIGGGYIGMEVAAAAAGWNLDTTLIFPEEHIMPRLFTPSLAWRYEELYQKNNVRFAKGVLVDNLEAGPDGRVATVVLKNGSTIEADTVIVGIGAKPVVSPFEVVGLNTDVGGIQVDSLFRTSVPGIFAVGDVAAFPLKMYDRMARVEHVDHARKSAQHCVRTLLTVHTQPYDYLPYFYSRVFEYEGSARKVWWQFYGDNVGDTIEVGNFDPKIANFWLDSGSTCELFYPFSNFGLNLLLTFEEFALTDSRLKGIFLESGSPEEFALLPQLAKSQPVIDKAKLRSASSVEDALEIARSSPQVGATV
ncbi:hypothetical protein COCNU_08G007280 [Cocos nucifera]|uniref:monodehydroascorbate reductase (NADH) n=1 Tax=Cocos nucifera TaxID=13894 RepID=A0A8K0IIE9_COCNU|nr:hypothetical protein COCNU_08G007280 [Cocos nucifera]